MADTTLPARRLMLVHAHPDDESSQTAATLSRYVAEGAAVTLVTCTLGELGDIVVPDLEYLREQPEKFGRFRLGELTEAMGALGVTDFVRLGGDGRWSDSGMSSDATTGFAKAADTLPDNAFWTADLLAAATDLVELIRDRRPQVVITYNSFGNYGHPDHIQAHRVAHYAYTLAAAPSFRPDLGEPWQVDRILWSAMPAGVMREMIRAARARLSDLSDAGSDGEGSGGGDREGEGPSFFASYDPDGPADPPMSVPDHLIAVSIDGAPWRERRVAALRLYRSQIPEDSFLLGDRGDLGPFGNEFFTLGAGVALPPGSTDVFAGL